MKKAFCCALLCLVSLGLAAQDAEFPLIQSLAYIPFFEHASAGPRQISFHLNTCYSNIFASSFDGTYFNDMEYLSYTLGLRYGLNSTLTLEAAARISLIQAGFMDRGIEAFHSFFGLPEARRKESPRNAIQYSFKDYYFYNGTRSWFSPLVLGLHAQLWKKGKFSLSGRASIGIPLQAQAGFCSGKPFMLGGLSALYSSPPFSGECSVYLAFFGKPEWLESEAIKGSLVLIHAKIGYRRIFLGFTHKSSPFREGDPEHGGNFFSLEYKISRHFTVGIMEDFYPFDTTADFGLFLRISG